MPSLDPFPVHYTVPSLLLCEGDCTQLLCPTQTEKTGDGLRSPPCRLTLDSPVLPFSLGACVFAALSRTLYNSKGVNIFIVLQKYEGQAPMLPSPDRVDTGTESCRAATGAYGCLLARPHFAYLVGKVKLLLFL